MSGFEAVLPPSWPKRLMYSCLYIDFTIGEVVWAGYIYAPYWSDTTPPHPLPLDLRYSSGGDDLLDKLRAIRIVARMHHGEEAGNFSVSHGILGPFSLDRCDGPLPASCLCARPEIGTCAEVRAVAEAYARGSPRVVIPLMPHPAQGKGRRK